MKVGYTPTRFPLSHCSKSFCTIAAYPTIESQLLIFLPISTVARGKYGLPKFHRFCYSTSLIYFYILRSTLLDISLQVIHTPIGLRLPISLSHTVHTYSSLIIDATLVVTNCVMSIYLFKPTYPFTLRLIKMSYQEYCCY